MFFIFGSPRSGTTLLAQCLSAHPEIIVPDETDFVIPMAFIADRIADPDERRAMLRQFIARTNRFEESLGRYLTRAEMDDLVDAHGAHPARLLEETYAALARKAGKRLAGDKSPNDLLFLRMLVKVGGLDPAFRIIHIVRDGRDVLSSILDARMTADADAWFPLLWNASNLYLNRTFGSSRHYVLLRYEDFVRSPERELDGLCAHLGVAFSPAMLDSAQHDGRYRGVPKHRKLYDPISSRNVGAYRSTLSDSIIARCESDAAPALATFGYVPPTLTDHMKGAANVSH